MLCTCMWYYALAASAYYVTSSVASIYVNSMHATATMLNFDSSRLAIRLMIC